MEQGQWRQAVKKGGNIVSEDAKEIGLSAGEADSTSGDFEKAARTGLDPDEAERLVKDMTTKGRA